MKKLAFLILTAGVMATTAAAADAGPASIPYPYDYGYEYLPPPGYEYPMIPDLLGRAVQMLGTVQDSQQRTMMAQDWLSFTRKIIEEEVKYRQQWLEFQKQQSDQAAQIEQLRAEVARLQKEVEQLRAGRTPSESAGPAPSTSAPATTPPNG